MKRFIVRCGVACGIAAVLSGCELLSAISMENNKEHSFKTKNEEVEITAVALDGASFSVQSNTYQVPFLERLHPDIAAACGIDATGTKSGLAASVAVFAAGAILDAGFSAIAGALEKQKRKYRQTHGTRVNIENFKLNQPTSNALEVVRCIYYERTFEMQDGTRAEGMQFALRVDNIGSDAVALNPVYLKVVNGKALTGKGDGIDLNVALAISTIVRTNPGFPKVAPLTIQSFEFKNVPVGETFDFSKWTEVSAIVPAPSQGTPATIALAVTETGSGYEDFGKAKSFVEANKKAVRDAVTGGLESLLDD